MSEAANAEFYRRPSKERLAQGDIGFAEIVQVRSTSGSERAGPGPERVADGDLPFLGPYTDHDLPVARVGGGEERRILRVWTTLGLVVTQNCELEWTNPDDSRVSVAPIVTRAQWPEGPWDLFRTTPPPGYFYLPELDVAAAAELGMADPWPEAIGCLASASVTTARIIKPRRLLATSVAALPRLQDGLARFYSTRGFADLAALTAAIDKPIRQY